MNYYIYANQISYWLLASQMFVLSEDIHSYELAFNSVEFSWPFYRQLAGGSWCSADAEISLVRQRFVVRTGSRRTVQIWFALLASRVPISSPENSSSLFTLISRRTNCYNRVKSTTFETDRLFWGKSGTFLFVFFTIEFDFSCEKELITCCKWCTTFSPRRMKKPTILAI